MKNQSFGDNRDLIKFDLVYQIMKRGLVDHFTYIPMLTANDPSQKAPDFCRHQASAGSDNEELREFLDTSIINDQREVGRLEDFFRQNGFAADVYAQDRLFEETARQSYFDSIPKEWLERALILIDPDKGLEEDDNDAGNLLFSELRDIYNRMDDEACLMFTQRFPYELYEEYLKLRVEDIQDQIPGVQPVTIDDLDSIMFFLTRSPTLQKRLIQFLGEYAKQYYKSEQSTQEAGGLR
jgi:hypothetical protein